MTMLPNRENGQLRKSEASESGELQKLLQQETEAKSYERWEKGPEKQYIRRFGWVDVINDYIDRRNSAGVIDPIKLLTLPGRRAMDIGLFLTHGILTNENGKTLNVAICDKDKGTEIANKLADFGGVIAFSDKLLTEELRENSNGIPKQFPFDVINLDFCNTLIPNDQDNLSSLQWIFEYQRGQGFLLLLTARAYPNPNKYKYLIKNNIADEISFKEKYQDIYGNLDINSCLSNCRDFSLIVYPKLISKYAKDNNYRIIEHHVAYYKRDVEEGDYYMICHSFELDPIGLSGKKKYHPRYKTQGQNRVEATLDNDKYRKIKKISEEEYSQFIPTVLDLSRCQDVNSRLRENQSLSKNLTEEGEALFGWIDNS